jgi:hypothetical protein
LTTFLLSYIGILKMTAKIFAVACISSSWSGSLKSSWITLGALFNPDQNGFLVY